jgi:hypothetical protein
MDILPVRVIMPERKAALPEGARMADGEKLHPPCDLLAARAVEAHHGPLGQKWDPQWYHN